jgi:hypothetical protein
MATGRGTVATVSAEVGERFADIIDPDVYVNGVRRATLKRLRDEDPVS